MKRFMMFSVSILCLSIAVLIGFYVGSQRVEAQAPPDVEYHIFADHMGSSFGIFGILPNGDIYRVQGSSEFNPAVYLGNFWDGVVATDQSTWGDVKSRKK